MQSLISILINFKPGQFKVYHQPQKSETNTSRCHRRAAEVRELLMKEIGSSESSATELAERLNITHATAKKNLEKLAAAKRLRKRTRTKGGYILPTLYSKPDANSTDKVDTIYLAAMGSETLTCNEIAEKLSKNPTSVQRHMGKMLGRELVERVGTRHNGGNPPVLWRAVAP